MEKNIKEIINNIVETTSTAAVATYNAGGRHVVKPSPKPYQGKKKSEKSSGWKIVREGIYRQIKEEYGNGNGVMSIYDLKSRITKGDSENLTFEFTKDDGLKAKFEYFNTSSHLGENYGVSYHEYENEVWQQVDSEQATNPKELINFVNKYYSEK